MRTENVKITIEFAVDECPDLRGYQEWKDYVKSFAMKMLELGEYNVDVRSLHYLRLYDTSCVNNTACAIDH